LLISRLENDLDRVPVLLEAALPGKGAGAGLDRTGAGGQLSDNWHQALTQDPALENDGTRSVAPRS
jgi:hypothetical protein